MDDATLVALRGVAGASFDIAFAAMVGALATPRLLEDASSAWAVRGARRCRGLFAAAAGVALAASLAWMALQAILLTELPPVAALAAMGELAADTSFGRAWAVGTLAVVSTLALAAAFRYRAAPRRTLGLLLVTIALAHAGAGHAGADGFDWRVPAMAAHVLATGLWAGTVFAAALTVLRRDPDPVDGPRYAGRLSALATAALAGVVLTGLAMAWHDLGGSLAPLAPATASPWGLLLDAKLALAAAAAALGGFNRLALMPSLLAAMPRFARVLRLEAVLLAAALAAAAWVAGSEPPAR